MGAKDFTTGMTTFPLGAERWHYLEISALSRQRYSAAHAGCGAGPPRKGRVERLTIENQLLGC